MTMHVCADVRLAAAPGIGTYIRSLLAALKLLPSLSLSLLCRTQDRESFSPYNARLIPMQSPIYSMQEQWEYTKKIPPCDLFWSPHFNVPLLPIPAKKRITTLCDVYHLAHFKALTLPQKIYAKLLYNAAFFLSKEIVTISHFSKDEIVRYATLKPKKITVLPPPLDFPAPPTCTEKGDFLLAVSSLKPHKNLLRLLQGYEKLHLSSPLYIVGQKDGLITSDSQLMHYVEKSPFLKKQVQFLGFVSQKRLYELYSQARLFIFPSLYEGLGYPPLEAMASGCPVVAARAAAIPEVCGEAVEYIDPLSIDAIAAGIHLVLTDSLRRKELIQKGKEWADKRRDHEKFVEGIHACCCRA